MAKLSISSLLNKIAVNQFKSHPFAIEWRSFIVLIAALRLITMFMSSYASYFFYYDALLSHTNKIELSFYIALLFALIVELSANIALYKFFKFLLKGRKLVAITSFFAVVICFGMSFFATVNGLAKKQYQNTDKTSEIVKSTVNSKDSINEAFNKRIKNIENEITTIKQNPEGWQGAKRTFLTIEQQKSIEFYQKEIKTLQNDKKQAFFDIKKESDSNINKTQIIAQNEYDKFYWSAVVILIFQVLTGFGLMFFWSRIYNEIDKEKAFKEEIDDLRGEMYSEIWANTKNEFITALNLILGQMAVSTKIIQPLTEKKAITQKNDKPIIGFQNKTDYAMRSEEKKGDKICKYCGASFMPKTTWQLFCNNDNKCHDAWHEENGGDIEKIKKAKSKRSKKAKK